MAKNSLISWTHGTWNPWVGCDKIAPECAHCYIGREVRKQSDGNGGFRKPWGELYLTRTWRDPSKWQGELDWRTVRAGRHKWIEAPDTARKQVAQECKRIFTCSLSDFFHAKADERTIPTTHGLISNLGQRRAANACRSRR
jgi:protein gp37